MFCLLAEINILLLLLKVARDQTLPYCVHGCDTVAPTSVLAPTSSQPKKYACPHSPLGYVITSAGKDRKGSAPVLFDPSESNVRQIANGNAWLRDVSFRYDVPYLRCTTKSVE